MSSTCGIMMVKDEIDTIEHVVSHLLTHVDHVIVADNGSTDGTRTMIERMDNVTLVIDDNPGYYQSAKMTKLADMARDLGYDWVLPCDADEIWYETDGARIGDVLAESRCYVVTASLFDHVATALDPDDPNPFTRIGWRRKSATPLPKIACRTLPGLVIEQGNHAARYPGIMKIEYEVFVVRHFPYRSKEHFVQKARNGSRAYAATDLPETMGQHWRDYGRLLNSYGEESLHEVFHTWFYSATPKSDDNLIYDPAPIRRA